MTGTAKPRRGRTTPQTKPTPRRNTKAAEAAKAIDAKRGKKPAARSRAAKKAAKTGNALADYNAERKAQKEANEKASKALAAKTEKSLAPVAKRINAALEKAEVAEHRADDLRLTAATELAAAKKKCAEGGVKFKDWCEENVQFGGYDNARKLAAVGAADDPKLALEDLRARNAAANKKAREAAKEKQSSASKSGSSDPNSGGSQGAPESAFTRAFDALDKLPEADQVKMLQSKAKKLDVVVAKPDTMVPVKKLSDMDTMKKGFDAMAPSKQMEFLNWAAEQVGASLDMGINKPKANGHAEEVDLDAEMPAHLRRGKKPAKKGRAVRRGAVA